MEISLSFGGSFAIIVYKGEAPQKEVLKELQMRLHAEIDWVDPEDPNPFGLISTNSEIREREINEFIKVLPQDKPLYEVVNLN